jgi:hypothetical protein
MYALPKKIKKFSNYCIPHFVSPLVVQISRKPEKLKGRLRQRLRNIEVCIFLQKCFASIAMATVVYQLQLKYRSVYLFEKCVASTASAMAVAQ